MFYINMLLIYPLELFVTFVSVKTSQSRNT